MNNPFKPCACGSKDIAGSPLKYSGHAVHCPTCGIALVSTNAVQAITDWNNLISRKLGSQNNAAAAAVAYALELASNSDESMAFLGLWNKGCFNLIREVWPHVPVAVFIGVDPLFKKNDEVQP